MKNIIAILALVAVSGLAFAQNETTPAPAAPAGQEAKAPTGDSAAATKETTTTTKKVAKKKHKAQKAM